MNQKDIVTINGQSYDALSGLPVGPVKQPTSPKSTLASRTIHSTTQKSQTLMRRVIRKPAQTTSARPVKAGVRSMDIARSSKISRFAKTSIATVKNSLEKTADIPPTSHPIVSRAIANLTVPKPPTHKPAKDIKNDAITTAMSKPSNKHPKKNFFKSHSKSLIISAVSLIIIVLGGYLTYVNMPNLSVTIASAQAGINAHYPNYRPDGYSLDGPVTFSDSQVIIKFKANTGNAKFSLIQAKSSWDSSAVLDNIVRKKAGEQYITSQEQGITIFSFGGNAAWVNGGILYTINGNAPLSVNQVRRMATSL
jgi:hypothetical protein